LGFRALALTDSGNLYGALEFALAARREGIRPISGCEVEVAQLVVAVQVKACE
jgi:DNA polymerase-3 subunit alpha